MRVVKLNSGQSDPEPAKKRGEMDSRIIEVSDCVLCPYFQKDPSPVARPKCRRDNRFLPRMILGQGCDDDCSFPKRWQWIDKIEENSEISLMDFIR